MLRRWLARWGWARPRVRHSRGELGLAGEKAAEHFLTGLGYTIVERRARNPLGEIDLVAVDGRTVVFVEVKAGRGSAGIDPAEHADINKQQRLTRLALAWLKRRRLLENPARFDVVAVTFPDDSQPPAIKHYRAAFPASGFPGLYS
jgi:putative endonuclease